MCLVVPVLTRRLNFVGCSTAACASYQQQDENAPSVQNAPGIVGLLCRGTPNSDLQAPQIPEGTEDRLLSWRVKVLLQSFW